jgi:hypothetical protein
MFPSNAGVPAALFFGASVSTSYGAETGGGGGSEIIKCQCAL